MAGLHGIFSESPDQCWDWSLLFHPEPKEIEHSGIFDGREGYESYPCVCLSGGKCHGKNYLFQYFIKIIQLLPYLAYLGLSSTWIYSYQLIEGICRHIWEDIL